ncbi:MAG TPA: hypothetical protein VL307_15320 [Chitinophagaceae bacterium]|jgi:hypothetical protein|nr:hypothetical protein [Chitinophagaceae bacterium]
MNPTVEFLLSMSILIPLSIGIVRWKVIDNSYYPFLYNLVTVLLVELFIKMQTTEAAVNKTINIFSLIDFCLFAWLFHNWGLFNRNKKAILAIVLGALPVWAGITFFLSGFSHINNAFLLLYSAALIFFSVTTFNKIVVQQRINIFTNARFWICIGIIIFYSFFILTRATDISTGVFKHVSKSFKDNLQLINTYSNLFVNLLYAVAVIWIPRKKNITTLLLP